MTNKIRNFSKNIDSSAENKIRDKPPINITQAALNFMKSAIAAEGCLGIRIDVRAGGCCGMTYELEFVDEVNPSDIVVREDGMVLYISSKATLFIANMTIDYVNSPMGGNIIFENPNARLRCGCGKSFCADESEDMCINRCCA